MVTAFREEQSFRQPWLFGLIALAAAGSYFAFQLAGPHGVGGLLAVGIPLSASGWILSMTLITEVREEGLYVRFKLLWPARTIPYSQIRKAEATIYRPIRDYGGWGVRGVPVKAFNVSGNRGVLLTLASGQTLMIGSQRPDQLAAALQTKLNA